MTPTQQTQQRANTYRHYLQITVVIIINLAVYFQDGLQTIVNIIWKELLKSRIYNSVYFETWWTVFCYTFILYVPFKMDQIPYFDQYKINPNSHFERPSRKAMICDMFIYMLPLAIMDTFMVKKYCEVDSSIWIEKRKSWIQTSRALPVAPPSVWQITYQLLLSIIIYDAIFFAIHFLLHRNAWLYKHLHAKHHIHNQLHSRVADQLTVTERIMLILSANEALKILSSHPLTRTLFVPVFIAMLIDNHSGYDVPWGYDKIIPFGLAGGARYHYEHHMMGSTNYQPFFTYFDKIINGKCSLKQA